MVPVSRVIAIYARENGQGMAFRCQCQVPAGDEAAKASPLTSVPAAGAAAEGDGKVVQLVTPEPGRTDGPKGAAAAAAAAHGPRSSGSSKLAARQLELPLRRFSSVVEQPPCKR